jgi:arylsulfatase A-like enzyme
MALKRSPGAQAREWSVGWRWAWCVALAMVLASMGCPTREPAGPPNVVIIVLDTARADFFSIYGYPRQTTPSFDRLAATGVRFDRAYATSNWTVPSHASLLTGRYPSEIGVGWQSPLLAHSIDTLAEILTRHGYATRAGIHNAWISEEAGFDQGFDVFIEGWRTGAINRRGTAVIREPIAWIEEFAEAEQPFFILINFNHAHLPYSPSPPHRDKFLSDDYPSYDIKRLSKLNHDGIGNEHLQSREFQILRDLYAGGIHIADIHVGRLLDALERTGQLDDSLIIVTADHGELIGEEGRLGHAMAMREHVVRVPLVVRYPPRFAPGTVDSRLVSLVDVVPTVLDVTGVGKEDPQQAFAGRSLAAAVPKDRRFVVAEDERPISQLEGLEKLYPRVDFSIYDHPTRTILTDRYKLVWKDHQPLELYDLQSDPDEQYNLREGLPEVENRLLDYLAAWRTTVERDRPAEIYTPKDLETLEELRALGYIK